MTVFFVAHVNSPKKPEESWKIDIKKSQWQKNDSREEYDMHQKLRVIFWAPVISFTKSKVVSNVSHRDLSDLLVQEDRLLVRCDIHIDHALPYRDVFGRHFQKKMFLNLEI